jgi:hypothetical protein
MATVTSATHGRTDLAATTAERRLTTETKHSSKTSELYAMLAVIAGILIAAWYVGRSGDGDAFRADQAWLYVAIVAAAYLVSRGLAKSGSREPYWDGDADHR